MKLRLDRSSPISGKADNSQEFEIPEARLSEQETPVQDSEFKENPIQDSVFSPIQETLVQDSEFSKETPNQENLEVCGMDIDDGSVDLPSKKMSENFLRVLREELGDGFSAHKLLVIAVHGILLESGFVGFDTVSGMRADRVRIPDQWPSTNSAMSLWYTLPELLNHSTECIVLKFHCIGDLINVYGSLAKDDPWLHKLFLNKNKFAPIIASVWANSDQKDAVDYKDGFKNLYPENEMFEFWKMVKDRLALPLLIDLCERTGLNLPPCMMHLPTELKIKILESLPAVDIAKMGCVCSEMRYLASDNDLWKQKYADELVEGLSVAINESNWKESFVKYCELKKKRTLKLFGLRLVVGDRDS
ncbi:hypothetical protein Q3G72_003513 [Acer saccharum]|nr:hypothetical protein Q3G72_003513 [Acer saccharum]